MHMSQELTTKWGIPTSQWNDVVSIVSDRIVCHLCDQKVIKTYYKSSSYLKVHVWDVGLCFAAQPIEIRSQKQIVVFLENGLNQGGTKLKSRKNRMLFGISSPCTHMHPIKWYLDPCLRKSSALTTWSFWFNLSDTHRVAWSMWPSLAWQSQWKSLQNTLAPGDVKDAKMIPNVSGQKGAIPPVSRQNWW